MLGWKTGWSAGFRWSVAVLIAGIFLVTLAGRATTVAARPDAANQVVMENYKFNPATLTVKAGTTVTWINQDDDTHTVDGAQGKYKSKLMEKGDKFEFKFTEPGEYAYSCRLHAKMVGKIVVQP